MIWFLYNILFSVGFVLMLPRFLYRMARRGGYARDFGQRFVWYASDVRAQLAEGGRIWIHAVSVGEIFIALKFMNDWRIRRPDLRFVLTTTTSTAHAIGRRNVKAPDALLYFPLDIPWVMRRALDAIRPRALIMVELELWPNLVRLAQRRGLPILLINGRISDRSFRGYRKLRAFTRRILPMIDLLCVQSETDRHRFLALGAREQTVRVMGSAKYDVATADVSGAAKARAVLEAAGLRNGGPYLLGGSTWRGEEAILLDALIALRGRFPTLALLLAPRHAERTPSVLEEIEKRNLRVVRRSQIKYSTDGLRPDVLLIDTTGELKDFYACADVIFIGKSLTQHGGQNVIEPALYGKPVVVGPNMENFRAVMEDLLAAEAIVQVRDEAALRAALDGLLGDPARREQMGRRAADVVKQKSGVIGRTLDLADELVRAEVPTIGKTA